MIELTEHPAYKLIDRFPKDGLKNYLVVDYVILRGETGRCGLLEHREAADVAMRRISERHEEWVKEEMKRGWPYNQFDHYTWDIGLALATPYPAEKLFADPNVPYYIDKPEPAIGSESGAATSERIRLCFSDTALS